MHHYCRGIMGEHNSQCVLLSIPITILMSNWNDLPLDWESSCIVWFLMIHIFFTDCCLYRSYNITQCFLVNLRLSATCVCLCVYVRVKPCYANQRKPIGQFPLMMSSWEADSLSTDFWPRATVAMHSQSIENVSFLAFHCSDLKADPLKKH